MTAFEYIEPPASTDWPVYQVVPEESAGATQRYMVVCDEGWRQSIVCEGMYAWAADWLVRVLDRRPYAPKERP